MGARFWVRRFAQVFAGAFVLISAAHLLRGRPAVPAAAQAGTWAAVSAGVFTVSRYFQARRGQRCAICRDTPED